MTIFRIVQNKILYIPRFAGLILSKNSSNPTDYRFLPISKFQLLSSHFWFFSSFILPPLSAVLLAGQILR